MDYDIRIQVNANAKIPREELVAKIKSLISDNSDAWIYERDSKIARETIIEVQGTERREQIIPILTKREYDLLQRMMQSFEADE